MKNKKKWLFIGLGACYLAYNFYRMNFRNEKINILGLPREKNIIEGHYKSLIFNF